MLLEELTFYGDVSGICVHNNSYNFQKILISIIYTLPTTKIAAEIRSVQILHHILFLIWDKVQMWNGERVMDVPVAPPAAPPAAS
jgi:hypothetical protein